MGSGDETIKISAEMAVRERKFFVGGNWKMNGSKTSIDSIVEFLVKGPLSSESGNIFTSTLYTVH